jgi:hypothetical protein
MNCASFFICAILKSKKLAAGLQAGGGFHHLEGRGFNRTWFYDETRNIIDPDSITQCIRKILLAECFCESALSVNVWAYMP